MVRNEAFGNGLVAWNEAEIETRDALIRVFAASIRKSLILINPAITMHRCETPILVPNELINEEYKAGDYFSVRENDMALRPETTKGSYLFAKEMLNPHESKLRLPICVWQAGKSFRNEQDKTLKNMRLKEFWQQEFQLIYSKDTKCDYAQMLSNEILWMFTKYIGDCYLQESDRLPSYSTLTVDVVHGGSLELCSMSKRTDFEHPVFEIAIGLDRCVYVLNNRLLIND